MHESLITEVCSSKLPRQIEQVKFGSPLNLVADAVNWFTMTSVSSLFTASSEEPNMS